MRFKAPHRRWFSLTKEKFEQLIRQVVPCPDVKTTEAWYSYGLDMCDEFSYIFLQMMMTSFGFLKHNFSPETVQAVYGVISYAEILPSELVTAAVYMQNGGTALQVAALADQGRLMCFHTPRSADENSPPAATPFRGPAGCRRPGA